MANPMLILGGMSALGGLLSATSSMAASNSQIAANDFNAQIAERNAGLARESAAYDAALQEREGRLALGSMRAAYGASGVTMEGSPLDVLQRSAQNAELDRQAILYRGELKALGYQDTATLNRTASDSVRRAAPFQTASDLLTGTTNALKLFTTGSSSPSAGAPIRVG